MSQISVHATGLNDVVWSFETSKPSWRPRVDGSTAFAGATDLDPFPGYAHEVPLVEELAAFIQTAWTPRWDVHVFVSDRECAGRTNAFASYTYSSSDDNPVDWGYVFLAGKRIPPHPAMTRHLMAHEYGHQVEWMLEVATASDGNARQELGHRNLVQDYAKMRGLPDAHFGTGGTWHDSVSEVFACDFRLLVCGLETEYWPHPGVKRPHDMPEVCQWWDHMKASYA